MIKWIRNILSIIFIALLLFYLLAIVPQYVACTGDSYEGEVSSTIWGEEVDCSGENGTVIESLFEMVSLVLFLSFGVITVFHLVYKRNQKNRK